MGDFGLSTWVWPTRQTGAGSGLLISMLKKLQTIFWFDQSNNSGASDLKIDGAVLVEKMIF